MSQHWFTTVEGRKVLYGLDLPTGGYFYTEFYKDEEIVDDEVKNSEDGITLTHLSSEMKRQYAFSVDTDMLVKEWDNALEPTPLQYNVCRMFGKDLAKMLGETRLDLRLHY